MNMPEQIVISPTEMPWLVYLTDIFLLLRMRHKGKQILATIYFLRGNIYSAGGPRVERGYNLARVLCIGPCSPEPPWPEN